MWSKIGTVKVRYSAPETGPRQHCHLGCQVLSVLL